MGNLAAFKKRGSLENLTKALQATNNKKFATDERFWTLSTDRAGNGHAIIRFLDTPECDGEEGLPYVQTWSHGFQGVGGWYIESSLTTIGKPDPVSEYNTKLWKTNIEANQNKARAQKRKLSYTSNIKVIKDTANPENDGKVFLFKYGKKIFDKLEEKYHPSEEAIAAAELEGEKLVEFVPYDLWKGANFTLRARKVDGFRNYDKSEVGPQTPIAKTDEEIEKIWKSCYSLKAFLAPENFKSYDELKTKLETVLQLNGSISNKYRPEDNASRPEVIDTPDEVASHVEVSDTQVIDDTDALSYFKGLADAE